MDYLTANNLAPKLQSAVSYVGWGYVRRAGGRSASDSATGGSDEGKSFARVSVQRSTT